MAPFNKPLPFFFIIFLLIPQLIAATGCGNSYCGDGGPPIRFPFRLEFHQPSDCGYSFGFDLSCDTLQRPILYLLGLIFQVNSINYVNQTFWINELNYCMHKPFFDHQFSLAGTPFEFSNRLENYTYFSCPSEIKSIGPFGMIGCLGGSNYNVIAVPLSWLSTNENIPPPGSPCYAVSKASLPLSSSEMDYLWGDFLEVKLSWKVPDCSSCEATGGICGLADGTSSQIVCSSLSHATKKKIAFSNQKKKIAFGVLFTAGFMCIIVYAFHASCRRPDPVTREISRRVRLQGLIAELSTGELPTRGVSRGLDAQTIESYKKTQLGESLDLPDPNDKTCSICLGEYKPQETLRTIPECNHYFHVGCIDEWLRKNPTCPLCRNLPRTHEASLVKPHD